MTFFFLQFAAEIGGHSAQQSYFVCKRHTNVFSHIYAIDNGKTLRTDSLKRRAWLPNISPLQTSEKRWNCSQLSYVPSFFLLLAHLNRKCIVWPAPHHFQFSLYWCNEKTQVSAECWRGTHPLADRMLNISPEIRVTPGGHIMWSIRTWDWASCLFMFVDV